MIVLIVAVLLCTSLAFPAHATDINSSTILTTVVDNSHHYYIAGINLPSGLQKGKTKVVKSFPIVRNSANNSRPRWSIDRKSFCFISDDGGFSNIYIYQLGTNTATNITKNRPNEKYQNARYFSLSEIIFTGNDGKLYCIDTSSGQVRSLKFENLKYVAGHEYVVMCGDSKNGLIIKELEKNRSGYFRDIGKYYLANGEFVSTIDLSSTFETAGRAKYYPENIAWIPRTTQRLLVSVNWSNVKIVDLRTRSSQIRVRVRAAEFHYSPDGKYVAFWTGMSDSGRGWIAIYLSALDFGDKFENGQHAVAVADGYFAGFDW